MKPSLIKKLCCPIDKEELALTIFAKDTEENILEGVLTCSKCKRYYPIAYGVPILSPDEYRELHLEKPLLERWKSFNPVQCLPIEPLSKNHVESSLEIGLPVAFGKQD